MTELSCNWQSQVALSTVQAAGAVDLSRELETQLPSLNDPEEIWQAVGIPRASLCPRLVIWGIPAAVTDLKEAEKEGRESYPETKEENTEMPSLCVLVSNNSLHFS